MFLKKIHIYNYKLFHDIEMNFEKSDDIPNVFSIASVNGGGKSTLLQFIFIMLNCFMDESKKVYIKNLLKDISFENDGKNELINFIISHKDKNYNFNFSIVPSNFEDKNFDLYEDEKRLKNELEYLTGQLIPYNNPYNKIQQNKEANHITELRKKQKLVESELHLTRDALEKLLLNLEENNLLYITHVNTNNILLLKTKMENELLKKLTKKIFLASPSSQVFHFFKDEEKNLIFKSSKENEQTLEHNPLFKETNSYFNTIKYTKQNIQNFFTYDFFSSDIILGAFEKAFEKDRKLKISGGEYGDNLDKLGKTLKDFLEDKEISVNEDLTKVIYRLIESNEDSTKVKIKQELSATDLSHGELKKLSIFIWLNYLVEEDSIVLMDEIDIALHPSWQYDLVDNLKKWSTNTQFFLATHSPQILSSTYYKNLILLDKKNNSVHQLDKPLDNNDINSVIDLIMGANHLPKTLDKLHIGYRKLVKEGKEGTEKAEELKEEILKWESISSSFFRRIDFFKKMRK
ncbi:hypothetical protein MNB_SV-12-879 [hydrothermal vent metagenome]|uniref:ATPase AAA-type core domain-containing protein n=1 Tax=hydrothermal vent metagenome TaxID=652676 RepID=A0A1W1CJL0_9ZZZZ